MATATTTTTVTDIDRTTEIERRLDRLEDCIRGLYAAAELNKHAGPHIDPQVRHWTARLHEFVEAIETERGIR